MSGRIWCATIPERDFCPTGPLPEDVAFIKGQLESGDTTGYRHWQLIIYYSCTKRLSGVRKQYLGHVSLSRSAHADAYVWKADTRIDGTQFSLGTKPIRRNSSTDWDGIRKLATLGTGWFNIRNS